MNSAGRFEDPAEIAAAEVAAASSAPAAAGGEAAGSAGGGQGLWEAVKGGFQRLVVGASFYYTKNPLRIKQVLRQVSGWKNKFGSLRCPLSTGFLVWG